MEVAEFGRSIESAVAAKGWTLDLLAAEAERAASLAGEDLKVSLANISFIQRGCPQGVTEVVTKRIRYIAEALGLDDPTQQKKAAARLNGHTNGAVHAIAIVPAKQQLEIMSRSIVQEHVGDAEISAIETSFHALSQLEDEAKLRAFYYLRLRLLGEGPATENRGQA